MIFKAEAERLEGWADNLKLSLERQLFTIRWRLN